MMNYPYIKPGTAGAPHGYPVAGQPQQVAPQGFFPQQAGQVPPPLPAGSAVPGPFAPSMGGFPGAMQGVVPGGVPGQFPGQEDVPPGFLQPGQLPLEQSYIENILRLNLGKIATFYMTFENNREWNAKIFRGRVEAAGRDHIIISDPQTGMRYLLLMVNLDYVTFDEELNYFYPGITGTGGGTGAGPAPASR